MVNDNLRMTSFCLTIAIFSIISNANPAPDDEKKHPFVLPLMSAYDRINKDQSQIADALNANRLFAESKKYKQRADTCHQICNGTCIKCPYCMLSPNSDTFIEERKHYICYCEIMASAATGLSLIWAPASAVHGLTIATMTTGTVCPVCWSMQPWQKMSVLFR